MKKCLNNGFFILFLPFACTFSACKHSLDADLVYGKVKIVYSTEALNNLYIIDIDGQNNYPLLKLRERGIDVAWFPNASRIVYAERLGHSDRDTTYVWLFDLKTKLKSLLFVETEHVPSQFSVSPRGDKIAYRRYDIVKNVAQVCVITSEGLGKRLILTNTATLNQFPKWSPDGSKIVFVSGINENADICMINSDGSGYRKLTDKPGNDSDPSFSPDGTKLVYRATVNEKHLIVIMNIAGTDPHTIIAADSVYRGYPVWSPDGTLIAFQQFVPLKGNRIFCMRPDGTEIRQLSRGDDGGHYRPQWAPDGDKIVFLSNANNQLNLLVVDRNNGEQRQITRLGSSESGGNLIYAISPMPTQDLPINF
jgi:Tol biopolymer transport system component